MLGRACISKMGIQICSWISKPKISAPYICVYFFFKHCPKWVWKSIHHFVHVWPCLHLQNGYPNILSYFKTEKFSPRYPRPFIFYGSSKMSPEINSSLCACVAMSLQNGYPYILSDFKTEKFNPRYPRPFVFHGSSEINPEINSSLCACVATVASPK